MKTMTIEAFTDACHDQIKGLPLEHRRLRHTAFICPMCKTVQSGVSLLRAGVELEGIDWVLAFACVGRFTGAGPYKRGKGPKRGCDWTLGGLFRIHKLEVVDDGKARPTFELATPKQAEKLAQRQIADESVIV